MLVGERRMRAQQIVQRVESNLTSRNGNLREAILDFREAFLDDAKGSVLAEVWTGLFETRGWGWLEENGFPIFVRNERETVFLSRLDSRLRNLKPN